MVRRLLYAVIFGLTVFYIIRNKEVLFLILTSFSSLKIGWIAVGLIFQVVWIALIASNLRACYKLLDIKESLRHLIILTLAGNFINVVAPSFGVGALSVFLADGQQRGKPAGKVITASFLYLVSDYMGFIIILTIGLIILGVRGLLSTVLIGVAIIGYSTGLVLILGTIIGIYSPENLVRVVVWLARGVNKILSPLIKRRLINVTKVHIFGDDLASGLKEIRPFPANMLRPIGWSLARKAMMMAILFFVSLANKSAFDIETLIACFSVSQLFTIVAFIPSGVGFVEGAMTLILSDLGQLPLTSVTIALSYRMLTFWLPLFYGLVAIRIVKYEPKIDEVGRKIISPSISALDDGSIEVGPIALGFQTHFRDDTKVIAIDSSGELKFETRLNPKYKTINISDIKSLAYASSIKEFEKILTNPKSSEQDFLELFKRNQNLILGDVYKQAHSKIQLPAEAGDILIPDFILEPIMPNQTFALLELKKPSSRLFVGRKNRFRFSASIVEVLSQLREYRDYFDEERNRILIKSKYGLLIYKPQLIVIIGRREGINPILSRKMQLDFPQLTVLTYDDVLDRLSERIKYL